MPRKRARDAPSQLEIAQVRRLTHDHRTIYLAGQTGIDANGKVAEGFRAQGDSGS
jgi:hypothetical protein